MDAAQRLILTQMARDGERKKAAQAAAESTRLVKIVITDEQGTVLDSDTVEVPVGLTGDAAKLRRELVGAFSDMNFNRISNMLAED